MRPLHLKLIATGLFAVCAALTLRQTIWQDDGSNTHAISPGVTQPSRGNDRLETPDHRPQPADLAKSSTVHGTAPSEQASTSSQTSAPESPPDKPGFGIQLADNVRLPAVILALSDPNRDPNHKTPAPVAAAMQAIVDRFYQDLAASVRSGAIAGMPTAGQSADTAATALDGKATVVIQPGPAVDQARARANETYRTLFGDEAFNRLTMNTALEVRLPVTAGSAER